MHNYIFYIIPLGTTTDGYEYFLKFKEDSLTSDNEIIERKINE